MAMPRSAGSTSFTTLPPIDDLALGDGSSSPAIMLSSVDFPQPEGPTKTTNSPSATSRSAPWMISIGAEALHDFLQRNSSHGRLSIT